MSIFKIYSNPTEKFELRLKKYINSNEHQMEIERQLGRLIIRFKNDNELVVFKPENVIYKRTKYNFENMIEYLYAYKKSIDYDNPPAFLLEITERKELHNIHLRTLYKALSDYGITVSFDMMDGRCVMNSSEIDITYDDGTRYHIDFV